jgi:iron complex transport system substrate-binding protein
MAAVAAQAATLPRRPRVYFEEWNEPLISGIGWVSELITLAGGEDCFSDLATLPRAKQRIIADPLEVVRRAPDIIIGSWCGKRFRPEQVVERDGWGGVPAVAQAQLFEIKSADILQPGIGALTDGLDQLAALIRQWAQS